VGHYRRYSMQDLASKVTGVGFTINQLRYVDSLGFFGSLVYKYTGSKGGDINPTMVRVYDRFIFPLSRLCDLFLNAFIGKNLLVVAFKNPSYEKPSPSETVQG